MSLCAGQLIMQCKKYKIEICRGLRWLCYDISHKTTNQKHAGAMERVYESRCNQGRVCRVDETIVSGVIREEVKTKIKFAELTNSILFGR
jgi:hypothetical protein